MNQNIITFDCEFDQFTLLQEACNLEGYTTFVDPKTQKLMHGWLIKKINSGYGLTVSNFIQNYFQIVDCRPRFYILEPNIKLPFHIDRGTFCSFNFILSNNPAPILFKNETIIYKNALVNTSAEHAVPKSKNRRILFKISIFDKSFQDLKNLVPKKIIIKNTTT